MRLRYTPRALAELERILAYIAERSPQGARRVQERIQAIVGLLVEHPHSGHLTSLRRHVRRIVATPYPYLIFYEAAEEEIIIAGVRHAARDPSSMPGGRS